MTRRASTMILLMLGLLLWPVAATAQGPAEATSEATPAPAVEAVAVVEADGDKTDEDDEAPTSEKLLAVIDAARPGLVRVEYTLQFDKGEAPRFYGGTRSSYGATVIEQERPLETNGFLVGDNKVLLGDLMIHPRFVKSIAVRFGEDVVEATPSGYAARHDAIFLDLARPLKGASPLVFDASGEGPYKVVSYAIRDGAWTASVRDFTPTAARNALGEEFQLSPSDVLLVTEEGAPVAIWMDSEMPIDDSWKGSPLAWEIIQQPQMADLQAKLQTWADGALLRVALAFRSPKKKYGSSRADMAGMGDEIGTERNVIGILIGPKRVLVLAELPQKATVRLDRIQVFSVDGDPIEATFAGTLKDYGCLLVDLEQPLEGAVTLADDELRKTYNQLLLLADVSVRGDNRVVYFLRHRIQELHLGWKRNLYPSIAGNEDGLFLFARQGRLVAFPISRRQKPSSGRRAGSARITAATQLAAVVNGDDLAEHLAPSNVPLTEEQENRLAWRGVALQPMSRELARANQVSKLTQDGETGAIVSYVYDGSPAADAGVEIGWILLRLQVEGEPKPLEVRVNEYIWDTNPFPWERFDTFSVESFDGAPPPWQPAENLFTRALTDFGFGKAYKAEFFVDGKIVKKDFTVVESPTHYESAPRQKSESVGLTVRNMTFELRRHFRKLADDPGVIVSKIESGARAAVAGLKPFEIITHINGQPVHNVKDFETLIQNQPELRMEVLRMTDSRVVKIKMPTSAPADGDQPPTTAPADAGPATMPDAP